MTIRRKLLLGYVLIALLVGVISYIGIRLNTTVNEKFEALTTDSIPTIRLLEELRFAGLRIVSSTNELGLIRAYSGEALPDKPVAREVELVQAGVALYNETLDKYTAIVADFHPIDQGHLIDIRQSGEALQAVSTEMIEKITAGAAGPEILETKERLEEVETAFLATLDQSLALESSEVENRRTAMRQSIDSARNTLIIAGLLALLLAVGSGYLIARTISTPILRLKQAMQEIEAGNLAAPIEVRASDEVGALAMAFRSMTTRLRQSIEDLEDKTSELQRSNAELAQFAYVASHDLQEPLRMVNGYLQLLERRYKNQLDSNANEFIAFAVDGATRMQQLIRDLLAYSRVDTQGKPFAQVDCAAILNQTLLNLKVALDESEARVTYTHLPVITADATQVGQLLQNLISNALKFRGTQPPVIQIEAQPIEMPHSQRAWRFMVRDNGIGLEAQYAERIFLVFQRLHTREQYPGTGIGLAICKRIVERHSGRIWVESVVGQGATFFFTIADKSE